MPRDALHRLPRKGSFAVALAICRQAVGLELTLAETMRQGRWRSDTAEVLKHSSEMGCDSLPAQSTGFSFVESLQSIGERSLFW